MPYLKREERDSVSSLPTALAGLSERCNTLNWAQQMLRNLDRVSECKLRDSIKIQLIQILEGEDVLDNRLKANQDHISSLTRENEELTKEVNDLNSRLDVDTESTLKRKLNRGRIIILILVSVLILFGIFHFL